MADRTEVSPPHEGGRSIVVIGLGRFGGAVATSLVQMGYEVLGIDLADDLVQRHADRLTHVVVADTTDERVLTQLGVGDFSHAVVGIGDVEASILTSSELVALGLPNIWAKATSVAHGRILERVGVHHVVFPEGDMGVRVAHLVTGTMMDYIQLDDGFALVETEPPRAVLGRSLAEAGIRARWRVTVVCVKPVGQSFTYATPETVLGPGDIVLVAGETAAAEAFAEAD